MDARRFDAWTRRLGQAATRRQVVAGAIAGAAAIAAPELAGARRPVCRAVAQGCTRHTQCCSGICRTGRDLPRRERNRCACPEGLASCGSGCSDLDTDAANCGACGNACFEGVSCVSGACANAALCFAKWPEETDPCVVSTEGGTYNQGRSLYSGSDEDERSFCTSSDDCQDASICSLSGVTCVCVTDDVWGPNPEDSWHYEPSICQAVVQTSACLAGAAGLAPFTRCSETVEGELWGSYSQNSTIGSGGCFSSDECNGDWDPLCDDPDYDCRCVFNSSSVPATNIVWFSRTLCLRDRVRLPA